MQKHRKHTTGEKREQNLEPYRERSVWDWHSLLRIALVFSYLFIIFSVSYFITEYFYHRIGYWPGQYKIQMTIVGVAVILFLMTGLTIGGLAAPKQRAFWQSLIGAIRQMAKGNFEVRIDVDMVKEPGGGNHPFRQLVYSINDMAEELAKLEGMRQKFISNVSHEIQSPLTAILGFVEALKNDGLTKEERRHYLNIIETEGKRMSRLSENLLKLTSLESGAHPFRPERFRLDRQIRDVVLSLEPLWMKKDIQFELSLQNTDVFLDKDLMRQVWINLLNNSIKFSSHGNSIYISLEIQDNDVVVRLRDTGIGITEKDLQHIFERFYKGDKSRQSRETGSGLGLTIVKKIVDIHKGEVQVESRVGVGTTFTIQLPKASS